jgi:hypothetical protein
MPQGKGQDIDTAGTRFGLIEGYVGFIDRCRQYRDQPARAWLSRHAIADDLSM